MKRPFKDIRPLGPIASSKSDTPSNQIIIAKLVADLDSAIPPIKQAAQNRTNTQGVEDKKPLYIRNNGRSFLGDVLIDEFNLSRDELDEAMFMILDDKDEKIIEVDGSEIYMRVNITNFSPKELEYMIGSLEDEGLNIKNKGEFILL